MNSKKVAVLLANGFEELEAVAVIDVLRRAGCESSLLGVGDGSFIEGSHGITMVVERDVEHVLDVAYDMVVLPGGMPGSLNLAESDGVMHLLRNVYNMGGYVAAICAAPLALQAADLLRDKRFTAYPGLEQRLTSGVYTGLDVEMDGRIVTGKGPGVALLFALQLVELLCGKEMADNLAGQMLVMR